VLGLGKVNQKKATGQYKQAYFFHIDEDVTRNLIFLKVQQQND
jgi:hypothetical protein